jgi:sulfur carrier protein ThiS
MRQAPSHASSEPTICDFERTMQVQVRLFSRLRAALPPETRGLASVELPAGANIDTLLDQLGIEATVKLISVNGKRITDRQRILQEGDRVHIFPPVVGG